MPTNGEVGGLASTSPQPAETAAGGESCSFSGFNHYHDHHEEGVDEDIDDDDDKDLGRMMILMMIVIFVRSRQRLIDPPHQQSSAW